MWGKHERRNKGKFKYIHMKRKLRKIRITRHVIRRKLESCGNG